MVMVFRSLAVASSLVLLVACSKDKPAAPPQVHEVGMMTVETKSIPFSMNFVAQTESSRQVEIMARVAGFLDRIAYGEGDFVKQGQILFQIDPKPFEAQLEAARGELGAQKARMINAQANLRRVKPLAEQKALSQSDLDNATGSYEEAVAAVHAAQAKVHSAEINLGYTTVRSPLNGAAGRAIHREGAYVGGAADTAQLTYVAALDPIWVTFSISQNQHSAYLEMVEKKQIVTPKGDNYEIEVIQPNGQVFPNRGKINFFDPTFNQQTASFMVRASVPNPQKTLRPGMFVTANVIGAIRPNAVVIPQLAVHQNAKGHSVMIANAENKVEIRPVEVGPYFNNQDIIIDQGLKAGDRVIVDGFARLAPGVLVKQAPAGKTAENSEKPSAEKK